MTKNEKTILLNAYRNILLTESFGMDKSDSKSEFKQILDNLNLNVERYKIENDVLCETNEYDLITTDTFKMIFDTFRKYDLLVHYDLQEIDDYYSNLQFEMNEEDKRCHYARIKILKEKLKLSVSN